MPDIQAPSVPAPLFYQFLGPEWSNEKNHSGPKRSGPIYIVYQINLNDKKTKFAFTYQNWFIIIGPI